MVEYKCLEADSATALVHLLNQCQDWKLCEVIYRKKTDSYVAFLSRTKEDKDPFNSTEK